MEQFNSPVFIKGIFDLVDQASADVKKSLGRIRPEALRRLEESGILKDRDFRLFLFHFYEACGFMHRRLESAPQSGEQDSPEDIEAEMYACLFHALMEMEEREIDNPAYLKISHLINENEDIMTFLWVGFHCFTLLARAGTTNYNNESDQR